MMNENENGNIASKFGFFKNLIEEYNENNDLINKLQKENYFLGISHIYSSMDGVEESYDRIDQKYADQLIGVLIKRNQEIEKIINNE